MKTWANTRNCRNVEMLSDQCETEERRLTLKSVGSHDGPIRVDCAFALGNGGQMWGVSLVFFKTLTRLQSVQILP